VDLLTYKSLRVNLPSKVDEVLTFAVPPMAKSEGSLRPLLLSLAGCVVVLTIAVATLSASAGRVALSESRALQMAEGSFHSQNSAGGSQMSGESRALQLAEGSFSPIHARAAGGKQMMLASAQRVAGAPLRVLEAESLQAYMQHGAAIKAKQLQEVRAALNSNYAFAENLQGGDAFVSAKHIRAQDREVPAPVLRSIASGAMPTPIVTLQALPA